jgi:hypothetical protein
MDNRNMENPRKLTHRLGEIAILLMVLLCVMLILADLTINLMDELNVDHPILQILLSLEQSFNSLEWP